MGKNGVHSPLELPPPLLISPPSDVFCHTFFFTLVSLTKQTLDPILPSLLWQVVPSANPALYISPYGCFPAAYKYTYFSSTLKNSSLYSSISTSFQSLSALLKLFEKAVYNFHFLSSFSFQFSAIWFHSALSKATNDLLFFLTFL